MERIRKQLKDYFTKLQFNEEKHIYTVDGEILPSVSKLITNFYEPFPKGQAKRSADREGITEFEILARWRATSEEACDRGNRIHDFGENYMFDRTLEPICGQEEAVVNFWNELPEHITPVCAELKMYHKELKYAGTADIVLYNRNNNSLIIADYKSNKDLFKNYRGKTMTGIFSHLLDCPFNKYQLQFSFYKILLEQVGIRVSELKLIWLLPSGIYKMYDTIDYTDLLRRELTKQLEKA